MVYLFDDLGDFEENFSEAMSHYLEYTLDGEPKFELVFKRDLSETCFEHSSCFIDLYRCVSDLSKCWLE